MKSIGPYLNFDGNTRDAMTAYHKCLGGELTMQTFDEMQIPTAPGAGGRIVHARITNGAIVLMASDSRPEDPFIPGNNFSVSIDCESVAEIDQLFAAFSTIGKATMPLADMFWGAKFGMIADNFGISWMFNCELKK